MGKGAYFHNQRMGTVSCNILCIQTCTWGSTGFLLGERVEKMSPEEREWAEEKLGLNDKISVQYARWIRQAFHGNFGISYKYKMDVLEVLKSRIGNTLVLGGIGFLIIFFGSLLLGIVCAWKEAGGSDRMIVKWEP